jgi:hypothetical protein
MSASVIDLTASDDLSGFRASRPTALPNGLKCGLFVEPRFFFKEIACCAKSDGTGWFFGRQLFRYGFALGLD